MSPCVNSNPDIAGIGVRVSIYTQALVNLAEAALLPWDGVPEPNNHVLFEASTNLFLTGCAIVASTIIQARADGQGLSVYHALIALNLGWINSLSGIQPIATSWAETTSRRSLVKLLEPPTRLTSQYSISHLLATIHLSAVAGVGIWVWTSVDTFGSQPECTPQTFLTLLGQKFAVIGDGGTLQQAMIAIYWIFLWPFANIALIISVVSFIIAVAEVVALIFQYLSDLRFEIGGRRFVVLFCITSVEIIFITDTELMISRSSGTLVTAGEAEWSFGQVLALLMTFFPLLELIKRVSKSFNHRNAEPHATIPTYHSLKAISLVFPSDEL